MPNAGDVLAELHDRSGASRDAGNFGPVVLLDQSEDLIRLVGVWRNVPAVEQPDPETPVPDGLPESAHLRWYWSLLDPGLIPTWIRTAGLPDAPHVRRLCWSAIDNRLVYPDGNISQWAEQYLSRTVAARMQARVTRSMRR